MIRIFKVDEADELIWQLSFNDREIQKILEGRDRQLTRNMNPYRLQAFGGVRAAANAALHAEAQRGINQVNGRFAEINDRIEAEMNRNKSSRPEVPQMELEPDESCCVCFEDLKEHHNLSYCKFGCGRNLHTECMEKWVVHKQQNGQKISCPLCRTDWGKNALEELKAQTKEHKEM